MRLPNLSSLQLSICISAFSLLGSTSSSYGQWTLIEDYEDGEHPSEYRDFNTNKDGLGDGGQFIQQDPTDPENMVALITADTGDVTLSNFNVGSFPLERPIEDGDVATYYMRHMKTGFAHDVVWGFSSFAPPPEPLFYSFDDHHVHMQYSVLNNGNFGVHLANPEIFFPELDTWYEVWTVIDNATDNFTVYIKGGEFADQTMLLNTPFRTGNVDRPLTWFYTISITGNEANPRGTEPLYFDDFYIYYGGENLETPAVSETSDWYGFPVDPLGNVDTKSWLNWLNVSADPWIYSYSLNNYIFVTGDSSASSPAGQSVFMYVPDTSAPVADGNTWFGYSINENGIVNTDSWLQWLYVSSDPWVWSYSLEAWVYVFGDSSGGSSGGVWLFVPFFE